MYTDANTPGVTVYSNPTSGDCTWAAQSQSLATELSSNGGSVLTSVNTPAVIDALVSFAPENINHNTGTGVGTSGAYGTETIQAIFTDNPLFKVVDCAEYANNTTGSVVSCQTPFQGAFNTLQGGSSGTQIGDIQVLYSPSASEPSGTTDSGNVIIEVHNSTGYGYYSISLSGGVQ